MTKAILLIDRDDSAIEVLKEYTEMSEKRLLCATTLEEAKVKLTNYKNIVVIICDTFSPHTIGLNIVASLKEFTNVPIVFSTRVYTSDEKKLFYCKGAVNLLTKPYSITDLHYTLAVSCNMNEDRRETEPFQYDDLRIDYSSKKVVIGRSTVKLTKKEFELLSYLVSNRNNVVCRDELLAAVWNKKFLIGDRTVDTHINSLRKKIGKYKNHVKTVRGFGYVFEVQ